MLTGKDAKMKRLFALQIMLASILTLSLTPQIFGESWGMPAIGPQRFEPEVQRLTVDPPLMYSNKGQLVSYMKVEEGTLYATGGPACQNCQVQPPEGSYVVEQGYYQDCGGFWRAGPVRRWITNGNHPVARGAFRVGRAAVRVVTFPFRWLFGR